MDTIKQPSDTLLYFDNTFGDVASIDVPEALAKQAWQAVWQTVSPIDAADYTNWEASLVLADDADVRTLNQQFRGKNKPTNVLSFPDGDPLPDADVFPLGDVIIAIPTTLAEAAAQNKHPAHHLTHLMVHGFLHLCGYDHQNDAEADVMETLEVRILAHLDIPNPYENNQELMTPHE